MGHSNSRFSTGRVGNFVLALMVVSILVLMIIPLPTFLLDLLLTLNIGIAATLLLVSLHVTAPLKIATFPSLLLVATMFRLGLNVASTRLILLQADAGSVIDSFGQFVVSGNVIVGAVVFLILTLIQFIVIAKGSERVAEVAARFTLDAMPGKQMSIDAELRSGHISHEEAKRARRSLHRESQLYGAMDGAMKFVKGDAIAGLIITAVNIIGGLAVGMVQMKMSGPEAISTYAVLTVGDGLVSQIPSLLISLSAGFIITRVASEEEGTQLGGDIGRQIVAQPAALVLVGVLLIFMGLVPGMPTIPFMLLGAVALWLGRANSKRIAREQARRQKQQVIGTLVSTEKTPAVQEEGVLPLPLVEPLVLELSRNFTHLAHTEAPEGALFQEEMLGEVRSSLYWDYGVVIPPIKVTIHAELPPWEYRLLLFEQPVGSGLLPEACVAVPGAPGLPEGGSPLRWSLSSPFVTYPASMEETLYGLDTLVLDPMGVLAHHARSCVQQNLGELVNMETAQILLKALERTHPTLVETTCPDPVSLPLLTAVLKRLAQEGISLRHMDRIVAALADWIPREKDPVLLTEYVRMELRREVSGKYAHGGVLAAYLASGATEDELRASITRGERGSFLSMDPEVTLELQQHAGRLSEQLRGEGTSLVVIASMEVRRYLRQVLVLEVPDVVVLSYQELESSLQVQPMGEL